jgi:hypothetical protein
MLRTHRPSQSKEQPNQSSDRIRSLDSVRTALEDSRRGPLVLPDFAITLNEAQDTLGQRRPVRQRLLGLPSIGWGTQVAVPVAEMGCRSPENRERKIGVKSTGFQLGNQVQKAMWGTGRGVRQHHFELVPPSDKSLVMDDCPTDFPVAVPTHHPQKGFPGETEQPFEIHWRLYRPTPRRHVRWCRDVPETGAPAVEMGLSHLGAERSGYRKQRLVHVLDAPGVIRVVVRRLVQTKQ